MKTDSTAGQKIYEFSREIPRGWIEVSRRYKVGLDGRRYPVITCHAPIKQRKESE